MRENRLLAIKKKRKYEIARECGKGKKKDDEAEMDKKWKEKKWREMRGENTISHYVWMCQLCIYP